MVMSRNPVGLSQEQLDQMTKPKDILVASINLHLDTQIKENLEELASFQAQDLRIEGIKLKLATQSNLSEKYLHPVSYE
jgi:hypothetical protein